jgi:hypothetical protein
MTTKKTSQGARPSIISVPSRVPEFRFFFNSIFFRKRGRVGRDEAGARQKDKLGMISSLLMGFLFIGEV